MAAQPQTTYFRFLTQRGNIRWDTPIPLKDQSVWPCVVACARNAFFLDTAFLDRPLDDQDLAYVIRTLRAITGSARGIVAGVPPRDDRELMYNRGLTAARSKGRPKRYRQSKIQLQASPLHRKPLPAFNAFRPETQQVELVWMIAGKLAKVRVPLGLCEMVSGDYRLSVSRMLQVPTLKGMLAMYVDELKPKKKRRGRLSAGQKLCRDGLTPANWESYRRQHPGQKYPDYSTMFGHSAEDISTLESLRIFLEGRLILNDPRVQAHARELIEQQSEALTDLQARERWPDNPHTPLRDRLKQAGARARATRRWLRYHEELIEGLKAASAA